MSTFNAFYVRANERATLENVRQGFDSFEIEQHREFIGVTLPPRSAPEPMLLRLSAMLDTEVFWLGFQSAMDCFEFHHWKSGRHVRSLVYGLEEERIWERAEGTPEPWEAEFFFHPNNLDFELECAEDDERRETVKRVYRDREIEVGLMAPSIGSKEVAEAIAQHYGFPHYGI